MTLLLCVISGVAGYALAFHRHKDAIYYRRQDFVRRLRAQQGLATKFINPIGPPG